MANQRGQYGSSKDNFFIDPKSTGILSPEPPEELIEAKARANLAEHGIHGSSKYQRASDNFEQLLRDEMTRLRGSPTPGPAPDHSPGVALAFLGGAIGLVWGLSKAKSSPKLPKIDLPAARVVQR
jgi:hypothetical protein